LARWQAARGPAVTNLYHEIVRLGEFERHVLQRLDGKHDRRRLVEDLCDLVARGELSVQEDGEALLKKFAAGKYDSSLLKAQWIASVDLDFAESLAELP